jgi:hypothetical protein
MVSAPDQIPQKRVCAARVSSQQANSLSIANEWGHMAGGYLGTVIRQQVGGQCGDQRGPYLLAVRTIVGAPIPPARAGSHLQRLIQSHWNLLYALLRE